MSIVTITEIAAQQFSETKTVLSYAMENSNVMFDYGNEMIAQNVLYDELALRVIASRADRQRARSRVLQMQRARREGCLDKLNRAAVLLVGKGAEKQLVRLHRDLTRPEAPRWLLIIRRAAYLYRASVSQSSKRSLKSRRSGGKRAMISNETSSRSVSHAFDSSLGLGLTTRRDGLPVHVRADERALGEVYSLQERFQANANKLVQRLEKASS